MAHTCDLDTYHMTSLERRDLEREGYFRALPGERTVLEVPVNQIHPAQRLLNHAFMVLLFPITVPLWLFERRVEPQRKYFAKPHSHRNRFFLTSKHMLIARYFQAGSYTVNCIPLPEVVSVERNGTRFIITRSTSKLRFGFDAMERYPEVERALARYMRRREKAA